LIQPFIFNIGGVPEHFNIPIRKAIDEGVFKAHNIDLSWQDYKGGTGEMVKGLKEKKIDIGILLTEGAVKAAAESGDFKIIQVYVNSPLHWGIYSDINSKVSQIDELKDPSFCISRYGSGSHLMAYLLSKKQGWNLDRIEFVEVGNFTGALKELKSNPEILFLWERFMTKPFVDNKTIKKIGEIPTPWASFSIVVRDEILAESEDEIALFISLLSDYTYKFKQNTLESIDYISNYFDFSVNDMKKWIIDTDWNYVMDRPHSKLQIALDFLIDVNLVSPDLLINTICPNEQFWKKCNI
jgi:sulfonate transport system substrate-binding protein